MNSSEDIPKVETGDTAPESDEGSAVDFAQSREKVSTSEEWHVVVRLESEDERQRAEEMLVRLGLQPYEEWSTARVTSFRIRATDPPGVRQQLRRTDLGWTLVPPGVPDYLLHSLSVTGPDGRQFLFTDSPAQTSVGSVAAELVSQYPNLPGADRPVVVDHIPSEAQGQLNPGETPGESGVREGDNLRVAYQARAGGGSFFYHVFITFAIDALDFRRFSFVVTALDELYAALASAMAIKLDTDPSAVQSPELVSIVMQSPLTIELGATMAGGGVSIAALRVLAAVLRDPSLLGGFIPKVKTGWYDARAAQYEAQIRLEALRRLAGDVSVRVSSVNSAENEELELRALLVDGRDIER